MRMRQEARLSVLLALLMSASAVGAQQADQAGPPRRDAPYVPTPHPVVASMIELAGVKAGDVVYDLGCGDGRIVIAAVRIPGVRGVCVDIDPERIKESRQNAEASGVVDRIRFVEGDLFEAPIADATVVMIYLMPDANLRLRSRLLDELRPGTRVVSHAFTMGEWEPEQRVESGDAPYRRYVYLWTVPPRKAPGQPH